MIDPNNLLFCTERSNAIGYALRYALHQSLHKMYVIKKGSGRYQTYYCS